MNRDLTRSILSLALASILLATATLLISVAIDQTVGLRPGWPAIAEERTPVARRPLPPPGSYEPTIDQAPIDANLRQLWESLNEQETKTPLKFPVEVERAMSIDSDRGV
ncbi:hypothetical protein Poly24_43510 [Rosistilla carotiformis]|uniref:Uncharacterized protein n=1 Tax=Rosistilla carotiformis TaxID=2528017 RepID=A0A518JYL6_9BACT|nr:hypothetical protein [Rosistilla carotiformis]QDV70625.1 hypothetical protein Poly24_43510 [Rosistilla carotiformis]